MRAVLDKSISENIQIGEVFELKGEAVHHLVNVVRIKAGEQVMILNGNGLEVVTQIESSFKKSAFLKVCEIRKKDKKSWMDLALCLPKKDAYESILKSCVEMGISNIIQIKSVYSQKVFLSPERVDKIIETALIQSNNPYFPAIEKAIEFRDLIKKAQSYDHIFVFSTKTNQTVKTTLSIGKKNLMLIGPEGGFSKSEEEEIYSLANVNLLKLDLPIMRSTTAVNVALGYLLGIKDARS